MNPKFPLFRVLAVCAAAAFPARAFAQAAATATPQQLARYDTNKNGALDPAELAALQADEAKAAGAARPTTDPATGDSIVELSPFQVTAGGDKGYYASSTLSGTRLNS